MALDVRIVPLHLEVKQYIFIGNNLRGDLQKVCCSRGLFFHKKYLGINLIFKKKKKNPCMVSFPKNMTKKTNFPRFLFSPVPPTKPNWSTPIPMETTERFTNFVDNLTFRTTPKQYMRDEGLSGSISHVQTGRV